MVVLEQRLIYGNRIIFKFREIIYENDIETDGLISLKKSLEDSGDPLRKSIRYHFRLETYLDDILQSREILSLDFNQGDRFSQFPGYVL